MGSLGVIDSFSTSLNIPGNTVVVAGGEGVEVVQPVKGDSVLRGIIPESSSITGDVATSDVVGSLSTNEETITTKNSVSSESRALKKEKHKPLTLTCRLERTLNTSKKARVCIPLCL